MIDTLLSGIYNTELITCQQGNHEVLFQIDIKEAMSKLFLTIKIFEQCYKGTCTCVHKIGGTRVQLKPCRFACELFVHGYIDIDWEYILMGVTFGFRVLNNNVPISYTTSTRQVQHVDFCNIIEIQQSKAYAYEICMTLIFTPLILQKLLIAQFHNWVLVTKQPQPVGDGCLYPCIATEARHM